VELLLREGHTLYLLTKPRSKSGRGQKEQRTEIEVRAEEHCLSVFFHDSDSELAHYLMEEGFDLVIAIAYGKLIKVPILSIPRYGWLNLHFSLLPKYRGAAPVQRAILAGESKTGITIFKLDSGMDTGPIYLQREFDISDLSADEILNKFSDAGAPLLSEVLRDIENGVVPNPQEGSFSLARKISKEEAVINWFSEVEIIHRQVRAFNPKPGAWTKINGRRIRIERASISDASGEAGTILKLNPLLVACKSGALELITVCPEGSRSMSADEWVRGARILQGASFV